MTTLTELEKMTYDLTDESYKQLLTNTYNHYWHLGVNDEFSRIGGPTNQLDFRADVKYYRNFVLQLADLNTPYQAVLKAAIADLQTNQLRMSNRTLKKLLHSIDAYDWHDKEVDFLNTIDELKQPILKKWFKRLYAVNPFQQLSDNYWANRLAYPKFEFYRIQQIFYTMVFAMFGLATIEKTVQYTNN